MADERRRVNPYVGPQPFERDDANRFFGRRREARDLAALVVAHRVVLLYSSSGAGKSSLLNAGVLPLLEERGADVLPPGRVGGAALADSAANVYTAALLAQWSREPDPPTLAAWLATLPRGVDEEGEAVLRVLVLDQFEELFTARPDRWKERATFVEELAAALDADPRLRLVLTLREEYLAQLEPYAELLPGLLRTRFRLERLGYDAALEAVTLPLRPTRRSYAAGVAEGIVRDLLTLKVEAGGTPRDVEGEYVEPVQLQVVCRELWNGLPADVDVITSEHVQRFADLDAVLAAFYEDALAAAAAESGARERRIRTWVRDELITAGGTRSTVYREVQTTAGLDNRAVEALERKRLIRAEPRAGGTWYELTHDRLIDPIRGSNARSFARVRRRRLRAGLAAAALAVVAGAVAVAVGLTGSRAEAVPFVAPTLAPAAISFGTTGDPTLSARRQLTLASGSESGDVRLTVTGDASDFRLRNGCGDHVAANRTCTLDVAFKPVALGERRARVLVVAHGRRGRPTRLTATLSGTLAGACGVERWNVKTLQDPDATRVDLTPQDTTIQKLTSITAPPFNSAMPRRAPVEVSTFRVRAALVGTRIEEDGDLKVLVAAPSMHLTMAAEFPAAACTLRAPARLQTAMQRARQAIVDGCGTPGATGRNRYRLVRGKVTLIGVGFFDSVHGQTGGAPNGIELHPVLGVERVDCAGAIASATVIG